MQNRLRFTLGKLTLLLGTMLALCSFSQGVMATDGVFWTALSGGKPDLNFRLRYENVDDDTQPRDANATTARIALGYKTGSFHGFGFYGQVEHVQEIFGDNFSYPGRIQPGFPAVVDPQGTEINQAYLFFDGNGQNFSNTSIRIGRQELTYREAPFHRFIGTVLWRQNRQSLDAVSLKNTSLSDTTLSYAYLWNVNRIFGDDAPSPLNDFESDSHLFNLKYDGFALAKVEAYAYLLDFDNADQFSTNTYGLRANGSYPLQEKTSALYALEYAHQNDAANNPNSISADYMLGELGIKLQPGGVIQALTFKISYEIQEGNGGADRFVTILGTNHAYQGWADRFLITPGSGIEDLYFTVVAKAFGAKFVAVYHDFSSDLNSFDYGTELDLLAVKTFRKHYTAGLKYSDYNADQNAFNSGSTAADVSKFWAFIQLGF